MIRDILTEALRQEGCEVVTAGNGQEAIDILAVERFDLIFTDIVMPGVGGVQVLQVAKRIAPEVQVIVMTGYPSPEAEARLLAMGASYYLSKPFNTGALMERIRGYLES